MEGYLKKREAVSVDRGESQHILFLLPKVE
jgi:hypothetical protein